MIDAAKALDDTWIDPRVWESHPDYVVMLMAAKGLVGRPDDARGDDARRCADGLPRIDPLTDLYNAVSLQHLVPIGGRTSTGTTVRPDSSWPRARRPSTPWPTGKRPSITPTQARSSGATTLA